MAIRLLRTYIYMLIGIVLVGASPSLFHKIELHPVRYFQEVIQLIRNVLSPLSLTYGDKVQRPIFPDILMPFKHSLIILLGGFVLAVGVCIVLAAGLSFMNNKTQERILLLLSLFEAIPDIIYIISIQLFIVFISNLLHVHAVMFVALGTHQIYLLPILVLSIVPVIYLLRIELMQIADEERKDYVEFAKGKGLGSVRILLLHILRNTIESLYINSKQILLLMLSSLFMVEYFFNIDGIMMFIYENLYPVPLTIGLALLLTVFFLFFSVTEIVVKRLAGKGGFF